MPICPEAVHSEKHIFPESCLFWLPVIIVYVRRFLLLDCVSLSRAFSSTYEKKKGIILIACDVSWEICKGDKVYAI